MYVALSSFGFYHSRALRYCLERLWNVNVFAAVCSRALELRVRPRRDATRHARESERMPHTSDARAEPQGRHKRAGRALRFRL